MELDIHFQEVSFEDLWGIGARYCAYVFTEAGLPKSFSWMDLQNDVYSYCTTKGHNEKWDKLYNAIKNFFIDYLHDLHSQFATLPDDDFLEALSHSWNIFIYGARSVDQMFSYLNRFYVPRIRSKATPQNEYEYRFDGIDILNNDYYFLENLALELWRREFFEKISERVTKLIIHAYNGLRSSGEFHPKIATLSVICKSYVTMCVTPKLSPSDPVQSNYKYYRANLEQQLLKATMNYYRHLAEILLQECNINDYLVNIERLRNFDAEFARQILPAISFNPMMATVSDELIKKYLTLLVENFNEMLRSGNSATLARMYGLFSTVDTESLQPFYDIFKTFVFFSGIQRLKSIKAEPRSYSQALHATYSNFMEMLTEVFSNDARFSNAFNVGFKKLLSSNPVAPNSMVSSRFIAQYCDSLLKKGQKMDEQAAEASLIDLMNIFQFLEEKDSFLESFHRSYCRRLLHGTSLSRELESMVIAKLQNICGHEATMKLNRTTKDFYVSETLNNDFKESSAYDSLPFGCNVSVFATSSWPMKRNSINLKLMPDFMECISRYTEFYRQQHSSRRLIWMHEYSTCQVISHGLNHQYRLQMTAIQYTILAFLQQQDGIGSAFEDIMATLQMQREIFQAQLNSLLKYRLIVEKDGLFCINKKYVNRWVKVNLVNSRDIRVHLEDKDEHERNKQIYSDRAFRVESMIVRLMKTEREMTHARLLTETVKSCRRFFTPEARLIKHVIDQLIEKEYIERDPEDPTVYRYIA